MNDLEILDPEIAPEQLFLVQKCRQTICPIVNAINSFIYLTSFVRRVSDPSPPSIHASCFLHFMYSAELIIPTIIIFMNVL